MSRRIPKRYTVLISCTGQSPITLSFRPVLLWGGAVAAIAIPTLWLSGLFYSYAERNSALNHRNSVLSQETADILEQIQVLEAEIQGLQERAGMPEDSTSLNPPPERPQGGASRLAEPEDFLSAAQVKLPGLFRALRGEVQPALEDVLDKEEARPSGIPLKTSYDFSSQFGVRRNPFGGGYEFHEGLDFLGAYGTPIYATAPGIVEKAENSGGYGYHVVINHGYGYRTLYAHLSEMTVTPGTRVDRDRIVGYLGNTGRSSGPHLHYGVYRNDQPVDPQGYLNINADQTQ